MELKAVLFDLWGTLIVDPEHRSRPRTEWRARNVHDVLHSYGHPVSFDQTLDALTATGAELSALHDKGIDLTARGRVDAVTGHLGIARDLPHAAIAGLETAICTMHPVYRPAPREAALACLEAVK